MATILYITSHDDWNRARSTGTYEPASLQSSGFIHSSTSDQVVGVANLRFHGQTDLVLLRIDTDRATAGIRYENLEGGEDLFPHIYGPLNLDAVIDVVEFGPDADGTFTLPEDAQEG